MAGSVLNSDLDLSLELPVSPEIRRRILQRVTDRWEPTPIALMGMPFDHVTLAEAVARIEEMIQSRKPHYVVTANVDFLIQARKDEELRRIIIEADLVLCDGTPLVWASRWLGNPLPERVAGADLVPVLIQQAVERGWRIFFLGGREEVGAQAVTRLTEQYPGLKIVGHYSPPFKPLLEMDHRDIRRRIHAAKPDLLLVSFGCPKAEKWMAMNYRSLGVPVSIGVGATIDFLAGTAKRAPVWMQKSGFEWLFRLLQEPRRLARRYAEDLRQFGWELVRHKWALRSNGNTRTNLHPTEIIRIGADVMLVHAPAVLDYATVTRDLELWQRAGALNCILDLERVAGIDSTGLGLLIQLYKRLHTQGRQLVILRPSAAVTRALQAARLETVFATAQDLEEARWRLVARAQLPPGQGTANTAPGHEPWIWRGELTARNAARAWRLAREQVRVACRQHRALVIDLREMRYVDSSGMRVLAKTRRIAAEHGGKVQFIHCPRTLARRARQAGCERDLFENP